ncbi:unnamed protein product [Urochloa decumbens]|uniref:Fe2OG dioxygenase domain-containing protein n=1 Tax=Urochloa decumbens TaxID=240449 RepID=A0ABC9F310_9POAL
MSPTESAAGAMASDGYDRRRELQAFDDTKAGVKGLVDAGITAIPPIFRHAPESLKDMTASSANGDVAAASPIPVIDLSDARREDAVAQVRRTIRKVGFFHVINHGVPAELMAGMLAGVRRFNEGPAEAKRAAYTRDPARKVRFNSNFDLFKSAAANWRDSLFCDLFPDPPPAEEYPEPIRDVITEYGDAVTKVALRVYELLSESLGLSSDHLREIGCAQSLRAVCQYYPPCPEPDLTFGIRSHTDPGFLTVLLQDGMGGLQILADRRDGGHGAWIDVPHVPGALMINIGDHLQVQERGAPGPGEQKQGHGEGLGGVLLQHRHDQNDEALWPHNGWPRPPCLQERHGSRVRQDLFQHGPRWSRARLFPAGAAYSYTSCV